MRTIKHTKPLLLVCITSTSTFFYLKKNLSFRGIYHFSIPVDLGSRACSRLNPCYTVDWGVAGSWWSQGPPSAETGGWLTAVTQQTGTCSGRSRSVRNLAIQTYYLLHTLFTFATEPFPKLTHSLNRYLHRQLNLVFLFILWFILKHMQQIKNIFNISHLHIMVAWGNQWRGRKDARVLLAVSLAGI